MGRKSIQINFRGMLFNKQTDFEQYIKDLIYHKIGFCKSVKMLKPEFMDEIMDLLQRHPEFEEKIKDMNDIKIIFDLLNKKALKIMIIRSDFSETDISWRVALSGKARTDKSELYSALRSSIQHQIRDFRMSNSLICEFCVSTDDLHVDHIKQFEEIAFDFLQSTTIPVPNVFGETTDQTHRRCFLDSDIDFENAWKQFHLQNASLRILCKKCNLTRGKVQIKSLF
jgi:hypothetical protein